MRTYIHDQNYIDKIFSGDAIAYTDFENCRFVQCDFTGCEFSGITFIDCSFEDCNFASAKTNYTAFRTVTFNRCELTDINFSMTDKLIFEIHFTNCKLDRSKFYALKLRGATFTSCSVVAVDFMQADLTDVLFDDCDLYRAVFIKTILCKTDFSASRNYEIDLKRNIVKKPIFSKAGLPGLLKHHGILIED